MTNEQGSRDEQAAPARPAWFRRLPWGPLGLIAVFSRGLIFDQHLRRVTMFYVLVVDMVMITVGDLFLADWLRNPPMRFAIYWLCVAWLVLLAALLAAYDLLVLRIQHRIGRRRLRKHLLDEIEQDSER